jgi:hypothetical protein
MRTGVPSGTTAVTCRRRQPQPPTPIPSFGRELTKTEQAYHASIEREKAAKKAERIAKLKAWAEANPALVEASRQLAKIKRRKRRNGKR